MQMASAYCSNRISLLFGPLALSGVVLLRLALGLGTEADWSGLLRYGPAVATVGVVLMVFMVFAPVLDAASIAARLAGCLSSSRSRAADSAACSPESSDTRTGFVCCGRSPFPRLEEVEEPRDKREHAVTRRVGRRLTAPSTLRRATLSTRRLPRAGRT